MRHLIHIGTPKTGSTFLQDYVFPYICENNNSFIYVGKINQKKSEKPIRVFDENFVPFNERIQKNPELTTKNEEKLYQFLFNDIERVVKKVKKNFIFSNECISTHEIDKAIRDRLTFFEKIGYRDDYWVVLRDPKEFVRSYLPSWILLEYSSGRLKYFTENQKLDENTVLFVSKRILETDISHGKNSSIINNMISYRSILKNLPANRLFVSHYEGDFIKNKSTKDFIMDRFNVELNYLDKHTNTIDDSFSRFCRSDVDVTEMKNKLRNICDEYFEKFFEKSEEIDVSKKIYSYLQHEQKTKTFEDIAKSLNL